MDSLVVATAALERNLGWVRTADQKVPPIFAVNAAMLGVLSVRLPQLGDLTMVEFSYWVVASLALVVSMVFLGLVAFPRLSGPTDSVVFFGTAAKFSETAYIERLTTDVSRSDLVFDLARQAYRNAEIAKAKYEHLRVAMIASFISLPFWLLALISTRTL